MQAVGVESKGDADGSKKCAGKRALGSS
jgi:hypothetical protein